MNNVNVNHQLDQPTESLQTVILHSEEIYQIDQALYDIGDFGEVHLIKTQGRLRFIRKITSEDATGVHPQPRSETTASQDH